MKKALSILVACILFTAFTYGQNQDLIKQPTFEFHLVLNDFNSATYIRSHSLAAAFRDHQFATKFNPGLGVSYLRGLSPRIDFTTTFEFSSGDYPKQDGSGLLAPGYRDQLLLELNAALMAKLFPDNYIINPFALVGIGASEYGGYYGAFIPLGVGIQARVGQGTFILFNAQYRVPATETVNYHFYYSLGIAASLVSPKPKVIPPPPVPVVLDRDKDGIVDSLDACPDVPGLAKYKGCPIPDTDGDGINDEEDKCPTVPGLAHYHGCPIPDTDGDGVNDEEDKCPTVPGPKENHGCPVVKADVIKQVDYDAQHIFFKVNKAVLLPQSFSGLDSVAMFMKQDQGLRLDIGGHTDHTGSSAYNQTLSEKRAQAVMNYLVSKGVDPSHMTATGYGDTKPIADNNTKAGRAKNRRVELKLKY